MPDLQKQKEALELEIRLAEKKLNKKRAKLDELEKRIAEHPVWLCTRFYRGTSFDTLASAGEAPCVSAVYEYDGEKIVGYIENRKVFLFRQGNEIFGIAEPVISAAQAGERLKTILEQNKVFKVKDWAHHLEPGDKFEVVNAADSYDAFKLRIEFVVCNNPRLSTYSRWHIWLEETTNSFHENTTIRKVNN